MSGEETNGGKKMKHPTATTLAVTGLLLGMAVLAIPAASAGSASAHVTAWCGYQYTGNPATSNWKAYSYGNADARLTTTENGNVFAQVILETRAPDTDTGSTPWKYRATANDEWDWHVVAPGYTTKATAEAKAEAFNAIGPNPVWHRSVADTETCTPPDEGGGGGGEMLCADDGLLSDAAIQPEGTRRVFSMAEADEAMKNGISLRTAVCSPQFQHQ